MTALSARVTLIRESDLRGASGNQPHKATGAVVELDAAVALTPVSVSAMAMASFLPGLQRTPHRCARCARARKRGRAGRSKAAA